MSAILSVVTYGGGDLLREFFNAVVISLGDSSFKTLIRISMLFGGMWALINSITQQNILLNFKWICTYILVTNLLFVPKVTIEIIDATQMGKVYAVDHVPLGLAALAHLTSTIGYGLTELTEKNFSLPDDLHYGKTGMVFASQIITAASQFQITDPIFAASMQSYVQQCVFYDLLLNKYSMQDLLTAPQLWPFLKANSSPARAFMYKNQVTVCRDGAAFLDRDWNNAIADAATKYGAQMLKNSANPKVDLLQYLQTGYGFLTNVSDTGAAILQQNLMASSINEGLQNFGAATNSAAALESYAYSKAQEQKRLSNFTMGDMAAYWLPLMKICFEGILYGAFIFVFLLSLFPFGLEVLKNYIIALIWLQMWAPLYAIINLIISFYAQSKSINFASGNLSLSAMGGLAQVNSDMAGLAGYLSLSVPFIAWGLVKGMGTTFSQLAQFVGSMTQGAAISTASEVISGNLSMGNTHFANHSMFNTNANHFDTNARYSAGMATMQTGSGSTISITPSGSEIMDNRAALSNLGVTVNMSDSIRSAAVTQEQKSISAGMNQTHAAAAHYSTALRNMEDFSNHQNNSTSSGTSFSATNSSGFSHSAHTVSQLVNSFAHEHNINHERAAQALAQVYTDAKVGGGFIVKMNAGVSASTGTSARSSFGGLYNEANRFATDTNFAATVDNAKREAIDAHYRTNNDQGNRYAESIASSFDRGDTLRNEASSNFSKADSFSKIASVSQENAAAVNANYTQEFYEWVRSQPAIMGHGTLSRSAIENMAVHDPAMLQDYANRFVQEKTSQVLGNINTAANNLHAEFDHNNQNIISASQIDNKHNNFNQLVHENNKKLDQVNSNIKNAVASDSADHQKQLDAAEHKLIIESDPLKTRVEEKVHGQVLGSLNVFEKHHDATTK